MAQELFELLTAAPTTSVAIGGALIAVALGFTALKSLSGSNKPGVSSATSKKKKTKSSISKKKGSKKKTNEVEAVSEKDYVRKSSDINLDDFVADFPDTEEEEAARADKKRAKRKLKKKKTKTRAATSDSDATLSAAAKAKTVKKDAEDGWETVAYRKKESKGNVDK